MCDSSGCDLYIAFFFYLLFFWCTSNNGLVEHIILHAHIILQAHTKLATTPPPLHQRNTINGTRRQTSTMWSRSPRDGWRRGMAAARFPAKTPTRTAPPKDHHLPRNPKRREAGGGVTCPLPIGGCGCNASKRGRGAE